MCMYNVIKQWSIFTKFCMASSSIHLVCSMLKAVICNSSLVETTELLNSWKDSERYEYVLKSEIQPI